jgi:L-ribulokinase
MSAKYTIGIDFGTDSVRALIVDVQTGKEISTASFEYPRWKKGLYCDPSKNQFRQHPKDYIEGIEHSVKGALMNVSADIAQNIVGLTIDTTGSTPVAVDKQGIPLSMKKEFEENPNAMFVLWKDHTSIKEAEEINHLSAKWETDYTKFEGGIYSSEWFWAKILHISRIDPEVFKAAYSWVEHCDWMPALLTGETQVESLKRSRCAAGHKAMWHEAFGGLPSEEFLVSLDPLLKGLRNRLYKETYTCDAAVGNLSAEWAERLGLSTKVVVGVGAFDAHLGGVGGEIKPFHLIKVMGTSTCDMITAHKDEIGDTLVPGICGQVDGSIVPGFLGMEAGQSAFGDIYAWYKNLLMWPVENILGKTSLLDDSSREKIIQEISDKVLLELTKEAEKIPISESGVLALDWMNGRRTPDANQNLKGAITGLSLGTNAPQIFRALVEATAYGSKAIVDRFISQGIRIDAIIALGGVAKKSRLVMQIMCDVLNMPIKVAKSEEACALGSAMAASVAAGIYNTFEEAQENMGSGYETVYNPIPENAEKYKQLYKGYQSLGNFIENEINKTSTR